MTQKLRNKIIIIAYVILMCLCTFIIQSRFIPKDGGDVSTTRDVYFIWHDAKELTEGKNPYARILKSTPKEPKKKNKKKKEKKANNQTNKNEKYTYYLPGFTLLASVSIALGLDNFQEWIRAWWYLSMLFHLAIGFLLFYMLYQGKHLLPAIFGCTFWLMSRWPLALFKSGQIDAIPIFFLVLSLFFLNKSMNKSMFFFSLSLAFKQMAAFLLPLYLLWAWRNKKPEESTISCLFRSGLLLAGVPFLISLPFIIWNAESFYLMMIFPLTREAAGPRSVDAFLGLDGFLAKLPFLGMTLILYYFAITKALRPYLLIFLLMFEFIAFNKVFFSRYVCWVVPLIPLICFEAYLPPSPSREGMH